MKLNQILEYVNYICVKENSGSTLKPEQFNTILLASNINLFNKQVEVAQVLSLQGKVPFSQALFSLAMLREFHTKEVITFTSGVFDLTSLSLSTFAYWGSLITLYNGSYKEIEILTDKDLADRRTNMIGRNLKIYPAAQITGNNLTVYPNDIAVAEFVFMKNPLTPIYDYYIDANLNLIYLPEGSSHLLTTGETGSAGQVVGIMVSLSKELEWNSLYHVEFCNEILQKVGINLKDEQLRAYVREVEGKQT